MNHHDARPPVTPPFHVQHAPGRRWAARCHQHAKVPHRVLDRSIQRTGGLSSALEPSTTNPKHQCGRELRRGYRQQYQCVSLLSRPMSRSSTWYPASLVGFLTGATRYILKHPRVRTLDQQTVGCGQNDRIRCFRWRYAMCLCFTYTTLVLI